ncbi:MAG TPA: DUF434 domain-containing protein [Methanothrix sp.]|jgi:hypothetical protein|uniref:DUF434 domain-containing protein n=1 Tax=Methanothrix sp. TaxID=90426 RepID=UPI002CD0FB7A|nr:DUF434 domain-containing protein [Methanothrix sp.]MDI9418451.1 DUF434 domain-containing protein [Euryarchaeota archaeon]HON36275.1 DUF434 domain-containing protein [Methanothrix sp.]HRU76323.1 DUF434 domain-containing protein [Methanothrix sp.]
MGKALEEARYLLDRGYPKDSAVGFVSNHHRLAEKERFILMRVVVRSDLAWARRSKLLDLEDLRGQSISIDGYNVIITTESVIGGYPVYLCDDGLLRDSRGIFRGFKASPLTAIALNWILDLLASAGPARTEVLLDQQMSRSGELAEMVRGMMAERQLCGVARTARNVDHLLKTAKRIILTSDGNVIDSVDYIMDLPAEIGRRSGMKPLIL